MDHHVRLELVQEGNSGRLVSEVELGDVCACPGESEANNRAGEEGGELCKNLTTKKTRGSRDNNFHLGLVCNLGELVR